MPSASDRERWLELFHDAEQLRFGMPAVIPVPASVDDIDERVAEAQRKFAAQQPTTFVVVAEDDPERFLGTVGWSFHVPAPLQVVDVGYSVHPDARGRGVATRALRTLTRWLTHRPDRPARCAGPARPQRGEPGLLPHRAPRRVRPRGSAGGVPALARPPPLLTGYAATTCACTGSSPVLTPQISCSTVSRR